MAETQELTKPKLVLPKTMQAPTHKVPRNAVWMGLPKAGKTTVMAELPNHLIIDAEKGSNFVTCNRIQPPDGSNPVEVFNWIREIAKQIKEEKHPYDHVVIETITHLDELSEWVGTYNYMKSPQGKSFNRRKDGTTIKFGEEGFESVNNLPEGYGYRWSRDAMLDLFDLTKNLGRVCTHYVGHVADKYLGKNEQANAGVKPIELAVTGKLKYVIPRDVDAVGYVFQKNGQLWVSFKGSEDKIGGMRGAEHLRGYEGPMDWNKIFLLDNKQ